MRNEKGQFTPGNKEGVKITATDGMAAEMGRKGGVEKAARTKDRKTLRELLKEELDEKDERTGLTRGQLLIKKAMANHAKGKLSFKDLKDLADLLGESIQNVSVQTDAPIVAMTPEAIQALGKWASKGADQEAAGE